MILTYFFSSIFILNKLKVLLQIYNQKDINKIILVEEKIKKVQIFKR
jgi:hypothetical protein